MASGDEWDDAVVASQADDRSKDAGLPAQSRKKVKKGHLKASPKKKCGKAKTLVEKNCFICSS